MPKEGYRFLFLMLLLGCTARIDRPLGVSRLPQPLDSSNALRQLCVLIEPPWLKVGLVGRVDDFANFVCHGLAVGPYDGAPRELLVVRATCFYVVLQHKHTR